MFREESIALYCLFVLKIINNCVCVCVCACGTRKSKESVLDSLELELYVAVI